MSNTFLLRCKGPVPNGGKPFLVERAHTMDGDVRVTLDEAKAKRFTQAYLSNTIWNWQDKYEKVPLD